MHNACMSYVQRAQNPDDLCFVRAYAKINLTLDVLGRRSDNYHALATVMQTVDLYDTLCLTVLNENRVELVCTNPELSNQENLAARAAELVRQQLGLSRGVRIELHKRIPIAAGLGGGSSDAAAVLLALQQWWHLPLASSDLLALATSLGSDVPFFLTGGLALCEGRGEIVTPLVPHWPVSMRWLVLLKPAISVATASVFHGLPASDYTDGHHSRAVCEAFNARTLPQPELFHNGLERSVLERYPEVGQAQEDLLRAGAKKVQLSGSGPTLFAPFAELIEASKAQQVLQLQGYEVYLTAAIFPTMDFASAF